jgi:hypothetical protein
LKKKLENKNIYLFFIKKKIKLLSTYVKQKIKDNAIYLTSKNYNINFIRKNKIFNKGRYSRNRQLYRSGVY